MIICLDLGATEIKCALMKKSGQLSSEVRKVKTDAHLGKEGILNALRTSVLMLMCEGVSGIAIASAGDIDRDAGRISYATDNLPGMTGFDFTDFCQKEFGLPVYAINDAHAALLGEMAYGVGRSFLDKRVAMLTLGSGVGGAYFANGDIVANKENDYARFGHICLHTEGRKCTCLKLGCAEMYLSGRALHRDAEMYGIDGADLFEKYSLRIEQNVDFVENVQRELKRLLDKICLTSPFDICIIGGGVTDWMGKDFDAVTKDIGYEIVKASLGNHAGIYGALYNYINRENQ